MKDIVINQEQWQQLVSFLQEQPHKFSAPLFGFFQQLINEQNAPDVEAPTAPTEAPLASKKVK